VLTGAKYGYAGRPQRGVPFVLAYPTDPAQDEDDLAAACPVADWQGGWETAPPCDSTCRAACETLVLARKARRFHNLSVDCSTNPADTGCTDRWPGLSFPIANGPALGFQVDVEKRGTATADPTRDLKVRLTPASAVSPLSARGSNTSPYHASGAVAFDRSPWTDPVAGYRFYVSYPADFVLDTTPSQTPLPSKVIR
jgi:hypothetical protein